MLLSFILHNMLLHPLAKTVLHPLAETVQAYLIDTIPKITVFTSANQQQIALSYQLTKTNDF